MDTLFIIRYSFVALLLLFFGYCAVVVNIADKKEKRKNHDKSK